MNKNETFRMTVQTDLSRLNTDPNGKKRRDNIYFKHTSDPFLPGNIATRGMINIISRKAILPLYTESTISLSSTYAPYVFPDKELPLNFPFNQSQNVSYTPTNLKVSTSVFHYEREFYYKTAPGNIYFSPIL